MSDTKSIGQKGEELAAEHLKNKGYSIRHRNWTAGKKEIDIVAENRDYIIFAEVKTRSGDTLINPAEAVTRDKQRSIIYAADAYIRRFDINKESRFDVITVMTNGDNIEIDHIENAFYPTLR